MPTPAQLSKLQGYTRSGSGTAGFAVGVLHIASSIHYLPGNIQNAMTLPFPVAYECVGGVDPADVFSASPRLELGLQAAAARLEARGVGAIVGACGSFAAFQSTLTRCVRVPVFASILTQINFIVAALPPGKKLAIVFADQRSFSERIRAECQISAPDRLLVLDCMALPAFLSMLSEPFSTEADLLEEQVVNHVAQFSSTHPEVAAIMLQCSELPPYAAAIQRRVRVPIFDVVTLADWVYRCVIRRPYAGYT